MWVGGWVESRFILVTKYLTNETARERLLSQAEQLGNDSQEQLLPSFLVGNQKHPMTGSDATSHTSVTVSKSGTLGLTALSAGLQSFCSAISVPTDDLFTPYMCVCVCVCVCACVMFMVSTLNVTFVLGGGWVRYEKN